MTDEQPSSNPAVLDLDDQVNQLLEQVDEECTRIETGGPDRTQDRPDDSPNDDREVSEPADLTPESRPSPSTEPAEAPKAIQEPEIADEMPKTESPVSETELDADLDAKVGEMIAEAEQSEANEESPESAPPPLASGQNDAPDGAVTAQADPAAVEEVDSCLADLTSQLLEGSFDSLEGDITDAATDPDLLTGEFTGEPTPDEASNKQAQGTSPQGSEQSKSIPFAAWVGKAKAVTTRVGGVALPVGASAVLKINKPLEARDEAVRQSIGWMAMYTGFLSLCVWGYVLIVRSPQAPVQIEAPPALLGEHPTIAQNDQGPAGSVVADASNESRQD